MSLTLWKRREPLNGGIARLRDEDEMDRTFDRYLSEPFAFMEPKGLLAEGWVPPLSVSETDSEVTIRAEVMAHHPAILVLLATLVARRRSSYLRGPRRQPSPMSIRTWTRTSTNRKSMRDTSTSTVRRTPRGQGGSSPGSATSTHRWSTSPSDSDSGSRR